MHTYNRMLKVLVVGGALLSLSVLGCSGGGGDGEDSGGISGDAITTALFVVGATSGDDGVASARVEVPAETNKLSISARTSSGAIGTDSVVRDDGTVFVDFTGERTTLSTSFNPFVSAVNIPSRDFDPSVSGGAFTMVVQLASSFSSDTSFTPLAGQGVEFDVLAKSDPDLSNGLLVVNIFYVGPAAGDGPTVSATRAALEEMKAIYGQVGVTIDAREFDIGGPSSLPFPTDGNSLYLSGSAGSGVPAVNIFVGFEIEGGGLLGISGGIPGSPLPSPNSGVAISIVTHAGSDGAFDSSEILVLGETLAHESGHFMGLFHPVEGTFDEFDPLTDTPTCGSEASCDGNDDLIHNLMYFVPVRGEDGALVRQNRLTGQQRGVMNRYAAVS